MRSDQVYLRHILDAIDRISGYVAGMAFAEFQGSNLVQDAVIRQLGIIGEAARCVSSAMQQAHPEVPWADIIGMRNILIHDYLDVDVGEVWKTIQDDLPVLRAQVGKILQTR
jgi:uncharacterized protein with HEPN domain